MCLTSHRLPFLPAVPVCRLPIFPAVPGESASDRPCLSLICLLLCCLPVCRRCAACLPTSSTCPPHPLLQPGVPVLLGRQLCIWGQVPLRAQQAIMVWAGPATTTQVGWVASVAWCGAGCAFWLVCASGCVAGTTGPVRGRQPVSHSMSEACM